MEKKVADLKVSEVLQMPLFMDNLTSVMNELQHLRKRAQMITDAPLKAHPIDRLQANGDWEPGKMAVMYEKIVYKELKGYPAAQREFIKSVGFEAYGKTMKTLIENEKAGI